MKSQTTREFVGCDVTSEDTLRTQTTSGEDPRLSTANLKNPTVHFCRPLGDVLPLELKKNKLTVGSQINLIGKFEKSPDDSKAEKAAENNVEDPNYRSDSDIRRSPNSERRNLPFT
ncbi:hypothetical protein RUM43_003618 [Polyplax serrata]|uniref:Uncharacterized protein n=1 Tax=Polyplax serrata TaxID=468196 RepID=A0AAN8RXB9_POLSC